jgi:opacity protein-like surface antigen
MMMRLTQLLAVTAIAGACVATSAQAQFSFGLGGGATIPSGSISDRQNTGYNALATLQIGMPLMPVAFRIDAGYNGFGGKSFRNALNQAQEGTDSRIISGTANVIWNLLPASPIKPYAIGGAGLYDTKFDGTESTRKFGWNYGGGVKLSLSGAALFVEARVHNVNEAAFDVGGGRSTGRFIPVTVGIQF